MRKYHYNNHCNISDVSVLQNIVEKLRILSEYDDIYFAQVSNDCFSCSNRAKNVFVQYDIKAWRINNICYAGYIYGTNPIKNFYVLENEGRMSYWIVSNENTIIANRGYFNAVM